MGDEDDGLALLAQDAEHAEEVVGLGRGQHAGRLVEDEHVGAAVERLEDFDALLGADRDVLDDRIGIDVEVVLAWRGVRARSRARVEAGAEQRAVLGAENDVLEDGEIVDQHEVLVDHADAERERMAAVGDVAGRRR